MGFSEWADMMPHSITVEPFASVDLYGTYTYGSPVTYQARIQGKNQVVTSRTGEEAVSHIMIHVASGAVGPQDRVTLPLPFLPSQPLLIDVQHVSDANGIHHSVVYA